MTLPKSTCPGSSLINAGTRNARPSYQPVKAGQHIGDSHNQFQLFIHANTAQPCKGENQPTVSSHKLLSTPCRKHCPAQRPVLVEHDQSSKPYSLSRDDKCHSRCSIKLLYCRYSNTAEAHQQNTLHENWLPLVHSNRHMHKLARVAKDDKQHCKQHPRGPIAADHNYIQHCSKQQQNKRFQDIQPRIQYQPQEGNITINLQRTCRSGQNEIASQAGSHACPASSHATRTIKPQPKQ
jgi:hypothetical protein